LKAACGATATGCAITAQLIDGLSGKHVWAERYEGDLKDIFALQDEITMKIITELRGKMVDWRGGSVFRKGHEEPGSLPEANASHGIYHSPHEDDATQARKLSEEVIALDPDIPRATFGWPSFNDGRCFGKDRFSSAGNSPCHGTHRKLSPWIRRMATPTPCRGNSSANARI